MFSIDHTYIRADIGKKIELNKDNKIINIGIPGAITKLRGLDTLKRY